MVTHIASYTVNLTNIVSRDSLLKQNHFYAHCVNLNKLLSICLQNKVLFCQYDYFVFTVYAVPSLEHPLHLHSDNLIIDSL